VGFPAPKFVLTHLYATPNSLGLRTIQVSCPLICLCSQISNIVREINAADQKVGASAIERFSDVMKEFAAIKAEVDKVAPPM
jgi:hypothetical protein